MKIFAFLLMILACSSCIDNTKESNITVQKPETPKESDVNVIEVEMKQLMKDFNWETDREYEMNQKYAGKWVKITSRTSGVNEEGVLYLQLKPYDETVHCFDIDKNFLLSVKKNDKVSVTGKLYREDGFGGKQTVLRNCTAILAK